MPPRAAPRSMKTASPLGQVGTSEGFWMREQTHPGAPRHPSPGGDFQGRLLPNTTGTVEMPPMGFFECFPRKGQSNGRSRIQDMIEIMEMGFRCILACNGLKGLLGYGYGRTVLPGEVAVSSLNHDDNRAD